MKAIGVLPVRLAGLIGVASLLLAGCAEQRVIPAPPPRTAPAPPAPPPPVAALDWRYAPLSPGGWTWSGAGRPQARFSDGALVLTCDRTASTVTIARAGLASAAVPMTILTANATRNLSALPADGPAVAVTVPARDPILDAMVFSRGRFSVEVAGLPPLVVPSWAEVGRLVEDCR